MRKLMLGGLVLSAAIGATALSAGAGATGSAAVPNQNVLHFNVTIAAQHFVDVGKKGNSIGDLVVLADHYRAPGASAVVGHDWENCTEVRVGSLLVSCTFSVHIPHGTLSAVGTFDPMRLPWRIPVTGGTGEYAGAGGVLSASAGNRHTEHFTFTLD